jgi:hypothetical protein
LKNRKATVRFTDKQRKFVRDAFFHGEKTKSKISAEVLCGRMKVALDESGKRLFLPKEWLSSQQIMGLYGRFKKDKELCRNIDEDEDHWTLQKDLRKQSRKKVQEIINETLASIPHNILEN